MRCEASPGTKQSVDATKFASRRSRSADSKASFVSIYQGTDTSCRCEHHTIIGLATSHLVNYTPSPPDYWPTITTRNMGYLLAMNRDDIIVLHERGGRRAAPIIVQGVPIDHTSSRFFIGKYLNL